LTKQHEFAGPSHAGYNDKREEVGASESDKLLEFVEREEEERAALSPVSATYGKTDDLRRVEISFHLVSVPITHPLIPFHASIHPSVYTVGERGKR